MANYNINTELKVKDNTVVAPFLFQIITINIDNPCVKNRSTEAPQSFNYSGPASAFVTTVQSGLSYTFQFTNSNFTLVGDKNGLNCG